MKPRSTSVRDELDAHRSPTSRPSKPWTSLPSTGGSKMRTQVPFSEAPVTIAVEALADASLEQQRRGGLPHLALDLVGVVLLLRAVRGQGVRARRRDTASRSPASAAFSEALRDEVREAPVRRGRVRVVAHREPEVPVRRGARQLDDVLARAHQLDD